MVEEQTAGNVAAGWELARRLPCWTVWYGEYTGRFWAVPRVGHLSAVPHIEAATPQELERAARRVERVVAERGAPPPGEPSSSGPHRSGPQQSGHPHGEPPYSGPAYSGAPYGDPPRGGAPYGDPPHEEAVPFGGDVRDRPPEPRNPPPDRVPGTSR